MSGHVFVAGGDLTQLACDDVLVPTDSELRCDRAWLPLLPAELVVAGQDDVVQVQVQGRLHRRVLSLGERDDSCTWLVDTVGDEARGLPWLLSGVHEALEALAGREVPAPRNGRARRLVGVPALGTGWGVAAGNRGQLLDELLPVLDEATTRYDYDIALVLREPTDVAAAQQVRRSRHGRWDLPDRLRDVAHRLGQQAQAGELALFAGAGIGAAAGLPTWRQLVQELAELCALDSRLREGLSSLPPQDAAALLARELGQERLAEYVRERFAARRYALVHALLAGLPVQELVTTNYDPLLEQAAAGAGRDLRVLPFDLAVPGHPWLLKLHGDASHPEGVVLTREHYLHEGHYRAALSGVMHTLLLTRHVLFVGASMLDDDLIRIAHEVQRALQAPGPREPRRSGTVLSLTHDPARARLWERDVETVAMSGRDTSSAEAARELEVLLDLLGCRACPPTGYLLDPAYRGMLDDDEAALARALRRLDEQTGAGARRTWGWAQLEAVLHRLGGPVSR
jgi:hypothetical protein